MSSRRKADLPILRAPPRRSSPMGPQIGACVAAAGLAVEGTRRADRRHSGVFFPPLPRKGDRYGPDRRPVRRGRLFVRIISRRLLAVRLRHPQGHRRHRCVSAGSRRFARKSPRLVPFESGPAPMRCEASTMSPFCRWPSTVCVHGTGRAFCASVTLRTLMCRGPASASNLAIHGLLFAAANIPDRADAGRATFPRILTLPARFEIIGRLLHHSGFVQRRSQVFRP